MYRLFAPVEPPKKKTKSKAHIHCCIGAADEHQLDCNQCKDGDKLSSPDRNDSITLEPLEQKHVEYIAPDHNLKCCYNASTLDRCRTPQGYLLQPPHFRIPMDISDAQKVSKAFNIPIQKQSANPIGQDRVQERVSNNQRLVTWARAHMNASQLWICPICWSHMTCSPDQFGDSAEITSSRKRTDPIQRIIDYILSQSRQNIDGFRQLVGTLSTSKNGLKQHLRHEHGVRRMPSELLEAYSLRGDDGILHRYLLENGYENDSAHGALLSYWRHNPVMFGRGVGFNKFIYLYIHYYAPRITSASLPEITGNESATIWTALTRPYSLVETAEDRDMFDDSVVDETGPVKTGQEEKEESSAAASLTAKGREYGLRDVSGYLTHEQLEALFREEEVQSDGSYSSESEDESERYRRELSMKKRRPSESSDDALSDSDEDDDLSNLLSKGSKSSGRKRILSDSDEDD